METHIEGTLTHLQRWGGFSGVVMFQRWPSQVVKNLPANAGDAGRPLSQEDPLEKETATLYSCLGNSYLPRKPHGQRSLTGCSPQGCKESDMTELLSM